MPLVGGGGSPNVAGGNPSGTGTGLNYIGNHAYAYSGTVALANNTVTQLDFTTGPQYIRAVYEFGFAATQVDTNKEFGFRIKMDNQTVYQLSMYTHESYSGLDMDNPHQIIIPPYTRVVIEAFTNDSAADTWGIISGRVYA